MKLPIRFPDPATVVAEDAEAFRRLSPEEKRRQMRDLLTAGALLLERSPHRDEIMRQQEEHEEAWRTALRELFKRHGR